MNVIVVDDERIILEAETMTIKRVLPEEANVVSFKKAKEAIAFAENNRIDIAFLDISLKGITGIELAKRLQECNPKMNIIFCSADKQYELETNDLFCSAYLTKPITDEKAIKALDSLRVSISE